MAAPAQRRDFAAFLRRYGTPESDYDAAEVIFGELVANVVRHAPGSIRVRVEWTSAAPTLHVSDCGGGFTWSPDLPHDPFSECQRGLYIVQSLSSDVRVRGRAGEGTCVSVTLRVAARGVSHAAGNRAIR